MLSNLNKTLAFSQTLRSKKKPKPKDNTQEEYDNKEEGNAETVIDERNLIVLYTAKALFDYDAEANDDLSFKSNDILEIFDDSDVGWWKARVQGSQPTGLIPKNFVEKIETLTSHSWFFGNKTKEECERLLRQEILEGVYLVRESESSRGAYTLSVTYIHETERTAVKHYKIFRKDDSLKRYYIKSPHCFKTIKELINFHSEAPHGLCTRLIKPCEPEKNDEDPPWEIERSEIQLQQKLGNGQFGQVYKALYGGRYEVAVKTLKENTMSKTQFLLEAEMMKQCEHPNIVTLLAICSVGEPIYIVTELMDGGALSTYLKQEKRHIKFEDLFHFAAQCAAGMEYLESLNFVHRDLAARNVLVKKANKTAKIADFGLARAIDDTEYIARTGSKFPVKWTAPEAAFRNQFSIMSDVWSFGILLYEIFSKGGAPYPDIERENILQKVNNGYRMAPPVDTPDEIYVCMTECWQKLPAKRPTFKKICYFFENYDECSRDDSYFDQ